MIEYDISVSDTGRTRHKVTINPNNKQCRIKYKHGCDVTEQQRVYQFITSKILPSELPVMNTYRGRVNLEPHGFISCTLSTESGNSVIRVTEQ